MLEILVLALEILHEESSQLGLEINWSKTKLQVSVLGHDVEIVQVQTLVIWFSTS